MINGKAGKVSRKVETQKFEQMDTRTITTKLKRGRKGTSIAYSNGS